MKNHTIGRNQEVSATEKWRFDEKKCAMTVALKILAGKWKLVILHFIERTPAMRFGELQRQLPGITQAMLTTQLRELERDGMILRKVYAQVPPRVEYSLTELGQTLVPIAHSLNDWGSAFIHRKQQNQVALQANSRQSPGMDFPDPIG